ncbi:MAG: peptidylprolyl isomerase, partial [Candidatus Nanohaloarchaea archaeon]
IGKTDGEIFDLTLEDKAKEENIHREDAEYKPVPVLIGEEYVIPGFEEQVKELEVGDEKEFNVSPEDGYGERDPDQIETYPEKEFNKQDVNVRPGEQVMIGRRRGKVISKNSGRVKVDFNHPLAGKELHYWVKVNEKVEDDEEIVQHIFNFRIGNGDVEVKDNKAIINHSHEDEEHQHELPEDVKEAITEEIKKATDLEKVEFKED